MKRSLSRLHVAFALALVALVVGIFPATTFAATSDYWPPYPAHYGSTYGCYHMVRYGDTMSSVAARYGTSVWSLMQMNGMQNPNVIYAGMTMYVPCTSTVYRYPGSYTYPSPYHYPGSYTYPSPYHYPNTNPGQCVSTVYIVQPGDNLYSIGMRFGVSPYVLAYSNGLYNPNLIYAGMRLIIPCSTGYGYPSQSYPTQPYPPQSYPPQPYPTQVYPVQPYATPGYPTPVPPTPVPPTPVPPMMTPPPTGQVMVVMRNIAFNPSTITIRAGQTVVWRNDDSFPHTTTSGSCPGGVCTPMPGWDSGTLNPGGSFSHTFTTPGTFSYYCRIHGAMMQGTVMVTP